MSGESYQFVATVAAVVGPVLTLLSWVTSSPWLPLHWKIMLAVFGVLIGLIGISYLAAAHFGWLPAKPPLADDRPQLVIEYSPETHCTRDPSGAIQARITIRNTGNSRTRLSSIKLDGIEPLREIEFAKPYSSQFHQNPLKLVRETLSVALDEGAAVEALLVHTETDEQWFWFDCDDGSFRAPRTMYRIKIVATGKGAKPAHAEFILDAVDTLTLKMVTISGKSA